GQVQHQLHPVGLLGGHHAEPALFGAVGGVGLDLEAKDLSVEPLGLVLGIDEDAGTTDAPGVLPFALFRYLVFAPARGSPPAGTVAGGSAHPWDAVTLPSDPPLATCW